MPYSAEKILEKRTNKMFEKMLKQFRSETEMLWERSITETFNELYEEAVNMYDKLIEDYYKYKTTSYYRHHVGIGTGTGENLYYGKQISINYGFIPELIIDFSGSNMDGYKNASADEVLTQVMHGIRGVPPKGWWTTWHGNYDGKYFSAGGVDVTTAFKLFKDNFSGGGGHPGAVSFRISQNMKYEDFSDTVNKLFSIILTKYFVD